MDIENKACNPAVGQRHAMEILNRRFVALALRIAKRLLRRGWGDSAITVIQKVVEYQPQIVALRIILARVAISIGEDSIAIRAVLPELVDHLDKIRLHFCRIAGIYMGLEDFTAAEKYLSLARKESPDSPLVWRMYGELNRVRGDVDDAVQCFLRAFSLEPTKKLKISALRNAATSLADVGRRDAEDLFKQILDLDQKNPLAFYGIVDSRGQMALADPVVTEIRQLITDSSVAAAEKSHLHYALGDVYAGHDDSGAAFAHWMIANQIRTSHSPIFDMGQKKAAADARCQFFTREIINQLSQHGCPEDILVCVVGMPRSGTTLIEQILGSHSEAHPMGERSDFFRLARNLPKLLRTRANHPECFSRLTGKDIDRIWRAILDRMRRVAGPCKRMITKLPEDFYEIGMIKILFPRAKIINTRRSPLDIGLSCFRQNFKHIPYSRDVDSLAEAYKLYQQMMRHWRAVLPQSSMLEVKYEELVVAPEEIVRSMCEFIDLPFEAACLEFHNRNRPVKTCSRWQAHQPIYQSSINRSGRYREFLWPLLALDDFSPPFPNEIST